MKYFLRSFGSAALVLTYFGTGYAAAEDSVQQQVSTCAKINVDAARLLCFDKLSKEILRQGVEDRVLYTWSGKGNQTTRPFRLDGAWELQWDSDTDGNFQVFLYSDDGEMENIIANQLGVGSGSAYNPKPGRYYLSVNATGSGTWRMQIVSVASQ